MLAGYHLEIDDLIKFGPNYATLNNVAHWWNPVQLLLTGLYTSAEMLPTASRCQSPSSFWTSTTRLRAKVNSTSQGFRHRP